MTARLGPLSRLATAVLCATLALAACGRSHAEPRAGDPIRLRVVLQPWIGQAPLLIAQAEGYFAEQGLDVEFVHMTTTDMAVPLLLEGRLDVLASQPVPAMLNAMARGQRVRAVAERGSFIPGGCSRLAIMTRPGLLAARRDRHGPPAVRRISINSQAPMRYLVDVGLAARGLALGDLETLFIPDAPELEALARGSIDAALVGDPWLTRALHERSAELWFPLDPMFSGESFGMVFFGPTLLDRDPDAGHRFLVAYLQGVRRFLEGKTERNLDILGEATAERRDILEGTCWPVMDPNGRLDPLGMRRYLEWTARQGLIDRAPTPAEFWDGRMIDRANEVLASSRSATHEPWAR